MQQIDDRNISETVAAAVRDMIVDGQLGAGERVNEVHLAKQLGISRTPLREALNRLAAEGALDARPRLGLFVRPLTCAEFDQLYDLRPILDPEALRLAGIPSPQRIARLERLNRALMKARDAKTAIALDDEWHLELLAGCPNRVLIEMIANVMLRTRRYELALMRERPQVLRAIEDHARILSALRVSDIEAACAALKHNMQTGKAPVMAWLKVREAAAARKRT